MNTLASDLLLYHGTEELDGDRIEIRSNTGVGSNDLTLGDGFYASTSKEIGLFYSHISMRNKLFDFGQDPDDALTGQVHQVCLSPDFRLLRHDEKLDPGAAVRVLLEAGISLANIRMLMPSQIRSFHNLVSLLEREDFKAMNAKEFIARQMGFDGLLTVQHPYLPWYYEPKDIGVDWKMCWHKWEQEPPKTIVIYQPDKILSTRLIHDGRQSSLLLLQREKETGRTTNQIIWER